jgi:tetrahydromethanopterin S-methyltransferase subunit F
MPEREVAMARGMLIGFILAIVVVLFLLLQCSRAIF